MAPMLTRRGLLLGTAGLALGAACGGKGGAKKASPTSATSAPDDALNVLLASFLVVAGSPQRVAFGVLQGLEPLGPEDEVTAAWAKDGSTTGTALGVLPRHSDGIEDRPFYEASITFPTPGVYGVVVRARGRQGQAAIQVLDPAEVEAPIAGRRMPAVPTPTPAHPAGVTRLCTREPACPWHDVSLDAALAEKRPVVLLVASPALCKSQTCGPVLEILLSQKDAYEGRVRFVHAEPYADDTGDRAAPITEALVLPSEPVLFLVGADGVVREVIDGAFDRADAAAALGRLAS